MLGESTKKFPKDATPTAAIQLLCFGMLFAVWPLGCNWEAIHQQEESGRRTLFLDPA